MNNEIIDFYLNKKSMNGVTALFESKFKEAYNQIKGRNKKNILTYSNHIFRRWYYSTLVSEKVLSPANIINTQVQRQFGEDSIIMPVPKAEFKANRLSGFSYDLKIFNIDNHPVIQDIKIILEKCVPDVEINEENSFNETMILELMKELTFHDLYYIDYLTAMIFQLKLIRKMPSINTNRASITNRGYSFCELDSEEQLKKIVNATIEIASKELSALFPISNSTFSKSMIYSLIEKPVDVDELFQKIYTPLGIDVTEVMKTLDTFTVDEDELNDMDEINGIILSSVFILSVFIDVYLICPLGYYLQLIQPLYYFSYKFDEQLKELYKAIKEDKPIESFIFSPCTFYDITPLGEEILLNGRKSDRKQEFKKDVNFEEFYSDICEDYLHGTTEFFYELEKNYSDIMTEVIKSDVTIDRETKKRLLNSLKHGKSV